MNVTPTILCEVFLILFVPVLLAVRYLAPQRIGWRTLVLVVAATSWICVNLAVNWAGDERAGNLALLFGWVPGLAIMVPCLAIYGLLHLSRVRRDGTAALPPNIPK